MNEVLQIIDDLKKVKQKLVSGDTTGAIKLIDETVAYKEKEVKELKNNTIYPFQRGYGST